MLVQIAPQRIEAALRALAGTKRSCISRLVASSMKTSSVQGPPVPQTSDCRIRRFAPIRRCTHAVSVAGETCGAACARATAGIDHPLPQRLARDLHTVSLGVSFSRQRRSEVALALPDQLDRVLADASLQLVVAPSTTCPVDQRASAAISISH